VREKPAFEGFPALFKGTTVPNLFLSVVLPQITDPAELLATLFVLRDTQSKRSYPRFARKTELVNDLDLRRSLIHLGQGQPAGGVDPLDQGTIRAAQDALDRGLEAATRRGTLACLRLADGDTIYCMNSPSERRALERVRAGDLCAGLRPEPVEEVPERTNIFLLYEDNIGPLTPIMADRLTQAELDYPEEWIADAIREAVENNARKWNYVEAVLKAWRDEGRAGESRSDSLKESWERYLGHPLAPRR
jgi:DnaD/phage-associated family protein